MAVRDPIRQIGGTLSDSAVGVVVDGIFERGVKEGGTVVGVGGGVVVGIDGLGVGGVVEVGSEEVAEGGRGDECHPGDEGLEQGIYCQLSVGFSLDRIRLTIIVNQGPIFSTRSPIGLLT